MLEREKWILKLERSQMQGSHAPFFSSIVETRLQNPDQRKVVEVGQNSFGEEAGGRQTGGGERVSCDSGCMRNSPKACREAPPRVPKRTPVPDPTEGKPRTHWDFGAG
jgi:hypothetical protein